MHFSRKHHIQTDGRTDRRTDGRTDTPSYRDARTHLKIKLPLPNRKLQKAATICSPFFTKHKSKTLKSTDGRFQIIHNKYIVWKAKNDSRHQCKISIVKLLVTLCMSTKALFCFLKHWVHGPLKAYTIKEKKMIRLFVKASHFPTRHILSPKVKNLL